MAKGNRMGTLLEKTVENIFKTAGFQTKHSYKLDGYEIDVFATLGQKKIVIQCKQYEKSEINVRDVIHEWDSKNKVLKADKVLIVIYGVEIKRKDLEVANQLGVALWDKKDLEKYQEVVNKKKELAASYLLQVLEPGLKELDKQQSNLGKELSSDEEPLSSYIGLLKGNEVITKKIKVMNVQSDYDYSLEKKEDFVSIGHLDKEERNRYRINIDSIRNIREGTEPNYINCEEPELNCVCIAENNQPNLTYEIPKGYTKDIMWLDKNRIVVDIVRRVKSEKRFFAMPTSISSKKWAKYVVILSAGKTNGIRPRDKITFVEID